MKIVSSALFFKTAARFINLSSSRNHLGYLKRVETIRLVSEHTQQHVSADCQLTHSAAGHLINLN